MTEYAIGGEAYYELYGKPVKVDITYLCANNHKTGNQTSYPQITKLSVDYGSEIPLDSEELKAAVDKHINDDADKRGNYTFYNWYLSPSLTHTDQTVPDTLTAPTNGMTLYAGWKPVEWTVQFETGEGSTVETQRLLSGEKIAVPALPTQEGKIFLGWYTQKTGGVPWDFNCPLNATVEGLSGNTLTLYAHWGNRVTVDYTVNHYRVGESAPFYQEKLMGLPNQEVTVNALTPNDSRYQPAWGALQRDTTASPEATQRKTLQANEANEFRFYYQNQAEFYPYTVEYREQGSELLIDRESSATDYKQFAVRPKPIAGYVPVSDAAVLLDFSTANHPTVTFYYRATDGAGNGAGSGETYYTITASAGAGGGITPSGRVSVRAGAGRTFTVRADEGWRLDHLLVDGKDVAPAAQYTFRSVRADHTIEARFARDAAHSAPADPDSTGVSGWLNTDDHIAFLVGYPEGVFRPSGSTTRAETAQMFYRLLRRQDGAAQSFADVPADAWYARAVGVLASHGIIEGVGQGRFEPDRAVTRAELTAIAMRFAKLDPAAENPFTDVRAGDWFYDLVLGAIRYGWITGYEDGTFRPHARVSRAEVAALMGRLLGRAADERWVDSHSTALRQFPDVPAAS